VSTQKFDTERFTLEKLIKTVGKEQYQVKISNKFAALENLDDDVNIKRAWETIKQNIKISAKESLGYYKSMQHKPQFNKVCLELLDQRKQDKLQWLQDPSEINGDNVKNERHEVSRHFRNKLHTMLKNKIMSLQHSKNKRLT
jgi:50S ribosomal subunit-associated GTPase HflX